MSIWLWCFYLPFLILLVLPLATNGNVACLDHGNRMVSSSLEANIGHLAAILPKKTSSDPSRYASEVAQEFPDEMYATSYCRNDTDSPSCQACIILAFQEAQTVCPYHKEVLFSNGNCSVKLSALQYAVSLVLEDDGRIEILYVLRSLSMAPLVFQAIGFAWLYFLLRQDWRDRKRRSMRSSCPLSEGK